MVEAWLEFDSEPNLGHIFASKPIDPLIVEVVLELLRQARLWSPRDAMRARKALMAVHQLWPRLPIEPSSAALFWDLCATLEGLSANLLRLNDDFRQALGALDRAWGALDKGSGDPEVAALLLSFKASLCRDLGRLSDAESAVLESIRLWRELGNDHETSLNLLLLASILRSAGRLWPALHALRRCRESLDFEAAPHLEPAGIDLNLAHMLIEAGDRDEGLALFATSSRVELQDPRQRSFARWRSGLIHQCLGNESRAIGDLQAVAAMFEESREALNLAQCKLDLAVTAGRFGQRQVARQAALEALWLFRSLDMPRESKLAARVLVSAT